MSGRYEIFKGSAACRFTLLPPKFETIQKEGGREYVVMDKKYCGVLVEAAPAEENQARKYKWEQNKVTVLFGLSDMAAFLLAIKEGKSWNTVHDPNMQGKEQGKDVKKISFLAPSKSVNWFLGLDHQREGTSINKVGIPISPAEVLLLTHLVEHAVLICSGFARW